MVIIFFFFCSEIDETLEQVAKRCEYTILGSVRGQGGWDLELPGPVETVPAQVRGVGTR